MYQRIETDKIEGYTGFLDLYGERIMVGDIILIWHHTKAIYRAAVIMEYGCVSAKAIGTELDKPDWDRDYGFHKSNWVNSYGEPIPIYRLARPQAAEHIMRGAYMLARKHTPDFLGGNVLPVERCGCGITEEIRSYDYIL